MYYCTLYNKDKKLKSQGVVAVAAVVDVNNAAKKSKICVAVTTVDFSLSNIGWRSSMPKKLLCKDNCTCDEITHLEDKIAPERTIIIKLVICCQ